MGGNGTLSAARDVFALGVPVVGVPKTIDNDIRGTDYTFGFDTALNVVRDAIDRLHTTAESHHRVMVVEVMGHRVGWIATYGGIALGNLIPQSWGLGFHLTLADLPGMRSAGTGDWAGVFNSYYWIDRTKRIGGVLMTQLLPFFDAQVVETLIGFEMAVYQQVGAAVPAQV